jgi:hypothetical protein
MNLQDQATVAQFAVLAYNPNGTPDVSQGQVMPTGWQRVPDNLGGSLIAGSFAGFAYQNTATGQVLIAYRGTNGVGDILPDLGIATGTWSTQFDSAALFASTIKAQFGSNILVTGHSLGGAMAGIVSQMFGFDGVTLDPGAAGNLVQTTGFQNAAATYVGSNAGLGMPASFTNYVVVNSLVSNASGAQLGNVQYMPGLEFSGVQAAKAFILTLVNPALGLPYMVGSDQFNNLHSSAQISQALNMFSAAAGSTTGAVRLVPVYQMTTDPSTGITSSKVVAGQFTVQDANGSTLMSLQYSGSLDNRQLKISQPDGTAKLINSTPQSTTVTATLNGILTQSAYTTADGSNSTITYKADGSANVVAFDASTGKTITTATNAQGNLVTPLSSDTFSQLLNFDNSLNYSNSLIGGGVGSFVNNWNDIFAKNILLTPALTQTAPTSGFNFGDQLNLRPIGAFYETVTPALDTALSIAAKTPVLRDTAGKGLTVASLTARDTNLDGKLTGTELNGLNLWVDADENGHIDISWTLTWVRSWFGGLSPVWQPQIAELKSLAQQGITQINAADYGFYTQGNAAIGAGVTADPMRPNEAVGLPATVSLIQAVPASNYATLRATDNTFYLIPGYYAGYYLNWTSSLIKINFYNQTYLIGTDGADGFNATSYASYLGVYARFFNLGLLTNFLAGGGNDSFGGSVRADNLWGGLGNDTAYGYAGDDKIYGDDVLLGQEGNDSEWRQVA